MKNAVRFYSVTEMASKWGISRRRVQILCAEGRIPGVMKVGKVWIIPSDAKKPEDPRRKT